MLSAPIHNANLLQIQGLYGKSAQLPDIPGGEAVGRISEVGDKVSGFEIGTLVFVTTGATWATEVVGPARSFIPLPPGDPDQLAMLISSPASALLMLDSYVSLEKGDWILQSAANSAVGSVVVQLARARGLRTVNLVRRSEVVHDLEQWGLTSCWLARMTYHRALPLQLVVSPSLALDAVGGSHFKDLVAALSRRHARQLQPLNLSLPKSCQRT